jgi:hypothetical protein
MVSALRECSLAAGLGAAPKAKSAPTAVARSPTRISADLYGRRQRLDT